MNPVPVSRARSSSRLRPRWCTARPAHHPSMAPSIPSWSSAPRPPQQAPPRPRRCMILLLCTCLDGSGDVADGDGVGYNHARGAGAVSAARRRADQPRRAHGHRARRVLIAAPPGCTPGVCCRQCLRARPARPLPTPAPPLATGPPHHRLSQPTLTRVALTCIYTACTTHSRHRLTLAARFHRPCPS